MGRPQVLVRFKQEDHAYFDIEGSDAFLQLKRELEQSDAGWIMIGPNAILKIEELDRIFYLPEGYPYAESSQSSLSQG